jgi:hypothetical protein
MGLLRFRVLFNRLCLRSILVASSSPSHSWQSTGGRVFCFHILHQVFLCEDFQIKIYTRWLCSWLRFSRYFLKLYYFHHVITCTHYSKSFVLVLILEEYSRGGFGVVVIYSVLGYFLELRGQPFISFSFHRTNVWDLSNSQLQPATLKVKVSIGFCNSTNLIGTHFPETTPLPQPNLLVL